jgi:hypothetical protein
VPRVKLHRIPAAPYDNRNDLWLPRNGNNLTMCILTLHFYGNILKLKLLFDTKSEQTQNHNCVHLETSGHILIHKGPIMFTKNTVQNLQAAIQTLYDSDSYAVVHLHMAPEPASPEKPGTANMPALIRHGFEIVDKRAGKEVYLDGLWAEVFQQRIIAWQEKTPTQDEVEDTLAGYAALAQTPVGVH